MKAWTAIRRGCLIAAVMLAWSVRAGDNPCIENGPYTNIMDCVQSGTFVTGTLTPTIINAAVGQVIVPPSANGYSITNGKAQYHVTFDCPDSGPDFYITNGISYTFGSVYFVPAIPNVFWTPGTYTYTAKVNATGSPCSPLTNTIGTVTINITNVDVLFDVDFGNHTNSLKTGYAQIGDSPSDFWNGYAKTNVSSGSLTSLQTAEGIVSPVGLLVTNLPVLGANGSSDAMYENYLGTNSGTATVTLTNLPAGTWNIYLYANDGNFDLAVGGTDYGTQTCNDSSPGSAPLAWQQGVQYVTFTNIVVTNGQKLTVTINPGTSGVAMISGLQIASINHAPSSSGGIGDSDYDGVSDAQELVDRTNPNDASDVWQIRLGYWPFDNTNTWVGLAGQLPLLATNVIGVPSWDTNAVLIDSTNAAVLKYRDVETNGNANINLRNGTVRFWFKPDWSSTNAGGSGPQNEGRLIEMGTKGSTNGWWGLVVNSTGTNINFGTQTNSIGTLTTNLTATISWTSNIWHQVVLTYSPINSSLYVDGQPVATNGTGAVYYPALAIRTNGFTVGSSASGTNQARGTFEDLETFNYPLDAGSIQTNCLAILPTITTQPTNLTVVQGSNAAFGVVAGGMAPLTYQWYFNSSALSGATNATLNINNAQTNNAGSYSVIVANPAGSAASSTALLTVLVPPTVAMASPANGQLFSAYPTNLTLTATVTDIDGVVTNVNFYNGTNYLGGTNASPYTLIWTNVTSGIYNLSARVTDNYGLAATSSIVSIIVDSPPEVSITNPANNSVMVSPTNFTINATASDGDGTVTQVQFFAGTQLLGSDAASPYSFAWSNMPPATYHLTAVATDNLGISGISSPITVTINASTNLTPIADSFVRNGSFTNTNFGTNTVLEVQTNSVAATNRDAYFKFSLTNVSGNISSAQLSVFARLSTTNTVSTTLYSVTNTGWGETTITWNNKPGRITALTTNTVGGTNGSWYVFDVTSYVRTQKAAGQTNVSFAMHGLTNTVSLISVNSRENSTNKPVLLVIITNVPPIISITSPANNSLISGPTNVTLTATASDSDGTISQVEFFQGNTSLGVVTNSPYTFVWSNVLVGSYAISTVATDNGGLSTTSAVINITLPSFRAVDAVRLWLKADAITGLTNSASIGIWPDSSGYTNNAIQTTSGDKPAYWTNILNGEPVVRFDGTNDFLSLTNYVRIMTNFSQAEMFVILRSTTTNQSKKAWAFGSASSHGLYPSDSNSNIKDDFGSTFQYLVGVPPQPITQFQIYNISAGSNWTAFANGLVLNNYTGNTFTNAASPQLGSSSSSFAGDMAEILIFNRTLTDVERDSVGTYLAGKYGFLSLPSPPATLAANPLSASQIIVIWPAIPQTAKTICILERKSAGGSYLQVAAFTNLANGSFVDSGLTANTQYYYRVRYQNYAGYSAYSPEAGATTFAAESDAPISDVDVWYGADILTGLTNGAPVTSLVNYVDQTRNASWRAAGAYPIYVTNAINGYPAIRFTTNTSTSYWLPNLSTNTGSAEMFVVLKAASRFPSQPNAPWRLGGSSTTSAYPGTDGSIVDDFASTISRNIGIPFQHLDQYHIYNVYGGNNIWGAGINGMNLASSDANSFGFRSSNRYLGGATGSYPQFYGDIVEFITFDRMLTAGERQSVEFYLNSKYAIITNDPPSVELISPANNAIFPAGSYINVGARFSYGGAYAQVQFFKGTSVLGTFTNSPYIMTWNNAPQGSYSLTAVATDNYGRTATSGVVNVIVDTPPSVTLTNPANHAIFPAGSDISIEASATDVDGTVTALQFFQGTNSLGTFTNAPYSLIWSNVTSGTYELTAQATDNNGLVSTSSIVTVISDLPPSVTLASPTNNAAFPLGGNINLNASAFDSDGTVTQVQFFLGTNRLGTASGWPYTFIWNNAPAGTNALSAVATDNDGLSATSGVVNVIVDVPPAVTVTNPINNSTFICAQTNVTLAATASDADGTVAQVQFFNGTNSLAVFTNAPYSFVWSNVMAGNYDITAVATDNNGIANTSAAVNFIITPISISITNPPNNALIIATQTNLTVMATASDIAGTITQVQFFQGTTSLGMATNSPYSLVWSNAPAGNYTLTAVASDNGGYMATSSVVNITITPLFATNTMRLWLKADAISGLSTNNAPVSTWSDSSGWNNSAVQGTGSQQPLYVTNAINGYPIVRFNGTSSYMTLPNFLTPLTQAEVFAVVKILPGEGGSPTLWMLSDYDDGSDSGGERYTNSDGSIYEDFGSAASYQIGVPAQPLGQYHVYEVSSQSTNWSAWISGVLLYQTNNNTVAFNSNPTLSSSGSPFKGDMAEIMIFNRALTSGERTTVNGYLNGKYGLVAGVPPAPANLVASAISQTQIGLTWSETLTNGGMTQASIERKAGSAGTYAVIAQVANALSYVDTNLAAGTNYYYRVRMINLATWSPYSNETNATTPGSGSDMPLGSLALWLKADSGLAQGSTNTPVDLWTDQSGNGNNAQQTSRSLQPTWVPGVLNSLPVVRFNGTGNYMTLPYFLATNTQAEVFTVIKTIPTGEATPQLWSLGGYDFNGSGAETYPNYSGGGSIQEDFGSDNAFYPLGIPAQPLTQYHVYEVSAQSTNWAAWINGVLLYQTNNNDVGFYLRPTLSKSDNPFSGDMAEVLIFNRALTPGERTTVNGYLNGKYGLILPKISITSPTNGAVLTAPANIPVNATIADDIGITQVQFFEGTASLGIVTNSPYSLVWSNVASGTYALTAQSMDNRGLTLTSSEVNVIVDAPPSMQLINPANNSVFTAGSNINLGANASDNDGTVSQVQFFQGSASLGIATNSPYSMVWSNVTAGTYALTAQATDNNGLMSTSSVVTVIADMPPSVTLTNPVNNARFIAVTNINLGASASDSDGAVTQVQFFQGSTSLGIFTNAPYGMVWSNVTAGTYALTAQATDNNGLVSTSAVVNITVAGVSITSPTNNFVFAAPGNVSLNAAVFDNVGISQVQFFQGTTSLGIVTAPPYSLVWSNVTAGVYVLTAKATESGGLVLTSSIVNVIGDTDPNNTDRDGDGVNDYVEYLEGRNPLVGGTVPDTGGIVDLQVYTPLQ